MKFKLAMLAIILASSFGMELQTASAQGEADSLVERARRIMRAFDRNQDRLLSPDEAPRWLRHHFARIDTDKDRALSLEELIRMMRGREEDRGNGNNDNSNNENDDDTNDNEDDVNEEDDDDDQVDDDHEECDEENRERRRERVPVI